MQRMQSRTRGDHKADSKMLKNKMNFSFQLKLLKVNSPATPEYFQHPRAQCLRPNEDIQVHHSYNAQRNKSPGATRKPPHRSYISAC